MSEDKINGDITSEESMDAVIASETSMEATMDIGGIGGGSDVTKAYVDQQDQAIRDDLNVLDGSVVKTVNGVAPVDGNVDVQGGGGSTVTIADNPDGGVDLTVDGSTKTLAKEGELATIKADLSQLESSVVKTVNYVRPDANGNVTVSGGSGSTVTMTDNPTGGVDLTVDGVKKTLANESDLTKLNTFVTPQDFGALADGTTDDTQAIQSAFDFGGSNSKPVYIPKGNYRITQSLLLKYSNAIIFGVGNASKIIKDFDGDMIVNAVGYNVSDVYIHDLWLFGNEKNGNGVYTYRDTSTYTRCGSIILERLTITKNLGTGIHLNENYISTIYECNVYYNAIGIDIRKGNGTTIDHNEIFQNEYGIIVTGGSFATQVINNTLQHNSVETILFGACYACCINHNYIENSSGIVIHFVKRAGIDGDWATCCQISNNFIECGAESKAIFIEDGVRNKIIDNYIECGTQLATIYFGSNSSTNEVDFLQRKSPNTTQLVEDLSNNLNIFDLGVKVLRFVGTAQSGIIDTGVKFASNTVLGAYCLDRVGWKFTPFVDNSVSSINRENWLLRVSAINNDASVGSGNFSLTIKYW